MRFTHRLSPEVSDTNAIVPNLLHGPIFENVRKFNVYASFHPDSGVTVFTPDVHVSR